MSIGTRLKEARIACKLTQEELAKKIGVSKGAIGNYETNVSSPKEPILIDLMRALSVDANYVYSDLMSNSKGQLPQITAAEYEYIAQYRALDPHGRKAVIAILEVETARVTEYAKLLDEPAANLVPFMVSDQSAAAGTGTYLGPESFHTIMVEEERLPHNASFGVPVSGDSMEPKFHDGDILIIAKAQPEVGEIGLFSLEGSGYVKKLGRGVLLSLNHKYDPIQMDETTFCHGKVIGIL